MEMSYRQAKRLWKRYQSKGGSGLVHGNAGRSSNRAQPKKVRTKVLRLIRQKYFGEVGERFGRHWPPSIWKARTGSVVGDDGKALDADGRVVELRTKSAPAPQAQRAARALRRAGADGRQLP